MSEQSLHYTVKNCNPKQNSLKFEVRWFRQYVSLLNDFFFHFDYVTDEKSIIRLLFEGYLFSYLLLFISLKLSTHEQDGTTLKQDREIARNVLIRIYDKSAV